MPDFLRRFYERTLLTEFHLRGIRAMAQASSQNSSNRFLRARLQHGLQELVYRETLNDLLPMSPDHTDTVCPRHGATSFFMSGLATGGDLTDEDYFAG